MNFCVKGTFDAFSLMRGRITLCRGGGGVGPLSAQRDSAATVCTKDPELQPHSLSGFQCLGALWHIVTFPGKPHGGSGSWAP